MIHVGYYAFDQMFVMEQIHEVKGININVSIILYIG